MEIHQSSSYTTYIRKFGWRVVSINGTNMFIRHFPFFGGLAKIQRSSILPNLQKLLPILKEHRVHTLAVEPEYTVPQTKFSSWCRFVSRHVRLATTPFLSTKTLVIDLIPSEEAIFQKFSEAKRRAVRRAIKNNLQIYESSNIDDLIKIKNKSVGLFGFITTTGIRELWTAFTPQHAAILLAYTNSPTPPLIIRGGKGGVIVGGVLLLFWKQTAYYWIAAATKKGKKLFTPTLLVWEAIKLSKKRGCTRFDFVGVFDERASNTFRDWQGFTKFKEGFGGTPVYYPTLR